LTPNGTAPALPDATVVGHMDALMKCGFQQYFAWIGAEIDVFAVMASFRGILVSSLLMSPERRDDIRKGSRPSKTWVLRDGVVK